MPAATLSLEETKRYQRHLGLKGFGAKSQLRLRNSRVLVIGAGGLGCPALLYLAAAGVGRITLIDPDKVDVSNLQRQVLYTQDDLGSFKAMAACRRLSALNPLVEILPRCERFTRENALQLVRDHDLVLDGSDNFSTRYLSNDACVLAGKPLVYGAIHQFEGQVSVFNHEGGPTYRCLFPEPPEPGTVPSCTEAGVLGVLPGLIGTLQATEAIKVLTGLGKPLSGRLLIWDALSVSSRVIKFSLQPASLEIRELPPEGYGQACCPAQSPCDDEITPGELREQLRQAGGVQLIDVREDHERMAEGSIEPSTHLPLGLLRDGHAPEGLRPENNTVVYCAGGVRSLTALSLLRQQHGFIRARSLKGGFNAWKLEG